MFVFSFIGHFGKKNKASLTTSIASFGVSFNKEISVYPTLHPWYLCPPESFQKSFFFLRTSIKRPCKNSLKIIDCLGFLPWYVKLSLDRVVIGRFLIATPKTITPLVAEWSK
jgi:hypothetical protein